MFLSVYGVNKKVIALSCAMNFKWVICCHLTAYAFVFVCLHVVVAC